MTIRFQIPRSSHICVETIFNAKTQGTEYHQSYVPHLRQTRLRRYANGAPCRTHPGMIRLSPSRTTLPRRGFRLGHWLMEISKKPELKDTSSRIAVEDSIVWQKPGKIPARDEIRVQPVVGICSCRVLKGRRLFNTTSVDSSFVYRSAFRSPRSGPAERLYQCKSAIRLPLFLISQFRKHMAKKSPPGRGLGLQPSE